MPISSAGLGSGLDVNGLVTQLMQLERRPIAALQARRTGEQAKLSAFGKVTSAVSALESALAKLSSESSLRKPAAASSDATVATASAASNASAGAYAIQVQSLAQQHKLATGAFSAATETLGSGTLTIEYGTYADGIFTPAAGKTPDSIAIDSVTGTLSGIRDALNAAGIGVSASIIHDGTGYRLALASRESGAGNSLRITVSDDDGNSTDTNGLSRLAFDPAASAGSGRNLTETVAAKDALVTVDGISISNPSNVFQRAIEGVTLTVSKVGSTSLTVAQDAAGTRTAIESFVTAYNDLNKTLRTLTDYDAEAKRGGALLGDGAVRNLQSNLRSALASSISGLPGGVATLSDIGVSFASDGSLAVNGTKLDRALAENFSGVVGLLAAAGSASDGLVRWSGATSRTQAGGYALEVTQLATRGALTGSSAAQLNIVAGTNDTLDLIVDGVSATVTLAAGSYASAADLAAALQSRINGVAAFVAAGINVTVGASSGVLTVTSAAYGSASQVQVTGGNGATDFFGGSPNATAGQSAAGTINGVAATGVGQYLTGATGDASEGLRAQILGGALGARGTVLYTPGIAARLERMLGTAVESEGSIGGRVSGIEAGLKRLSARETELERRMQALEARYRAQFTALDGMLTRMTNTSSFLQQQLNALR